MLFEDGHQVDIACKKEQEMNPRVAKWGGNVFDIPLSRAPIRRDNIRAYNLLKKIIVDGKYDIVHTHTPIASAITRLVCKKIPNVKVIYTAHGFHFYKGAPILNWIIYYPIEKYLSKFTDVLITINKEDYSRAKSCLKAKRTEYIPGVGVDVEKFQNASIDRAQKRAEIGVPEDAFLLLSVGELNKNKNHILIIKAIFRLRSKKIHYVICGEGLLEREISKLSQKLRIHDNIHLLGFRNDIPEILKASDIFLFPSKREGLGLAAIEAMASGLPIITSNIHGIKDYSIDGITGYAIKPNDVKKFAKSISNLMLDNNARENMGKYNISASKMYSLDQTIKAMKDIIS